MMVPMAVVEERKSPFIVILVPLVCGLLAPLEVSLLSLMSHRLELTFLILFAHPMYA